MCPWVFKACPQLRINFILYSFTLRSCYFSLFFPIDGSSKWEISFTIFLAINVGLITNRKWTIFTKDKKRKRKKEPSEIQWMGIWMIWTNVICFKKKKSWSGGLHYQLFFFPIPATPTRFFFKYITQLTCFQT